MSTVVDYAWMDHPGTASPDFAAMRAAGCGTVILRRSVGYYDRAHSAWVLSTDPVYARDAEAARAAGLVVGAYLFPAFGRSAPSPREQVAAFAQSTGRIVHGVDLPPCLDVEFPGNGIVDTGLSPAAVGVLVEQFVAELDATYGCAPLIYTSHVQMHDTNGLGGVLAHSSALEACPLWDKVPYPVGTGRPPALNASRPAHAGYAAWDRGDLWRIPDPWTAPWLTQSQGDALGYPGVRQCDLGVFHLLSRSLPADRRWAWVQRQLDVEVTGAWTEEVEEAVRAMQAAHGLDVDGVVGPRTFAVLAWA